MAEMHEITPAIGANRCDWPGLTAYKIVAHGAPQWGTARSLALSLIVQGVKRVVTNSRVYIYGPSDYALLTRGMTFQTDIVEASLARPFLSLVLQLDSASVCRMAAEMFGQSREPDLKASSQNASNKLVSLAEPDTIDALVRFLRAQRDRQDRRLLAPLFLNEIIYRLLQGDQRLRLIAAAVSESENNPISEVIAYIHRCMSERLTVAALADRARMSPSAFTQLFRSTTGTSPYQFVKRVRLDTARRLLIEKSLNVSEIASRVGYSNVSHFTNEFKRTFGVTPKSYGNVQRRGAPFDVDGATSRR